MPTINAGVVLVTKFVSAESAVFSGYIDYINRSNAVRNENIDKYTIPTLDTEIKEYNEYMEYMGDARKTTELFTADKDRLSADEKDKLKDIFQMAQNNGSLMWQSVISFDNKWLADNGLYDPKSGVLNEVKIKEYTRIAVNAMLEKEGLAQNSVWSASVHYNTDNIHIHIATVQPIPTREMKTIKTIRFNREWLSEKVGDELLNTLHTGENIKAHKAQNKNYSSVLQKIQNEIYIETGKRCKLGDYMQLNADGTLDISYYGDNGSIPYMAKLQSEKQVRKGVFKESSIESAKSKMVNKILGQNRLNEKINALMRNTLIDDFKNVSIDNHNLQRLYADIFESLPTNKRLWQYNNNVISPVRGKIDRFTTEWLKQYHRDDYEQLQEYLKDQQEMYRTAYGGTENDFAENKVRDLYSRSGNIILKSLKELAQSNIIDLDEIAESDEDIPADTDLPEADIEFLENGQSAESLSDEEISDYLSIFEETTYLDFSDKYKKAKRALYGTRNIAPDHQVAFDLLEDEAQAGNGYAIHDLANCFAKGLGCTANAKISFELYKRALATFESAASHIKSREEITEKQISNLSYLNYRIGKMYYYGQGTEVNKQKAFQYFSMSDDNVYSLFYLAKFYENGEKNVVDKNLEISFQCYSDVCEKSDMPYAYYKKAYMLEKGLGTPADNESSQENYKTALDGFLSSVEERPDDFLQYRIGQMYLQGKGCNIDIDEATKYLELSYQGGNDMAACALANIYIQNKDEPEKIKKAFELLHQSADDNNNVQAQYNLGKLYMDNGDTEKALKYFDAAAAQDNQFAQYKLGSYYLDNNEIELGLKYLDDAAQQDNEYAQYKLGIFHLKNNDTEKGIKYLLAAANQNNLFAQYRLGVYYLNNGDTEKAVSYLEGVTNTDSKNEYALKLKESAQYRLGTFYLENGETDKGIELLTIAADNGNQFAQYKLGAYFLKTGDLDKAIPYLTEAAAQDNDAAKFKLGSYYLKTNQIQMGVDCLLDLSEKDNVFANIKLGNIYSNADYYDFKKAEKYYLKATGKGISTAEYNLGMLYLSDKDNIRHCLKGMDYLKIAAQQGNEYAMYQLGKIYFYGNKFIAPDRELAKQYLSAAASKGHSGARYLLNRPNRQRLSLPKFHYPYEMMYSMQRLMSELARDYRTHENIVNQIAYAKLQQKLEEGRE